MNNTFFKPTKRYKIYRILYEIDRHKNLTQRLLSQTLNIAVSMVNAYLDELEHGDYIKRTHHTRKTVDYHLKPKGKKLKDVLSIDYLNATQKVYDDASDFIISALSKINHSGTKSLIFYGAGEVAEIVLNTYQKSHLSQTLNVLAIIDDDTHKQSQTLYNIPIIALKDLNKYTYDAIFISSYTHQITMEETLKNEGIAPKKIKRLFHA